MDCHYCKGIDSIEEQITLLSACEAPHPFLVENVPTFVCALCGDKSYSSETLSSLDTIRKGEAQVSSVRDIRVFDFQNLGGSAGPVFHRGDQRGVVRVMVPSGIGGSPKTVTSSHGYFLTSSPRMAGLAPFKMWANSAPIPGQPVELLSGL